MAGAYCPQRLSEPFIYIEHKTFAVVAPFGGTRPNRRQCKDRRRISKRFPPERDVLLVRHACIQPFLPFGEITILKRKLGQSIWLVASFGIIETGEFIEKGPHR